MNMTVAAVRSQVSDFFELTKPRIALLVLVTTFTGMWLAADGMPSLSLVFCTLLGTGLASSAAGTLNNYVDREVDVLMARTRHRALPAGRVLPQQALLQGLLLTALAFIWLWITVNPLTAALALITIGFYVVIYTIWLKRSSPWCTEIGGVAGALPPLIGWAAVTGSISWPALLLFLILMLWQPPHFWALALIRSEEYRRARLPMLPVVSGERVTKQRMLWYTVALLPATIGMYVFQRVGLAYLVVAVELGVLYLALTIEFVRQPVTTKSARKLFGFSIIYLLLLFTMMFVDSESGGGMPF